jgi:hypothetical protein
MSREVAKHTFFPFLKYSTDKMTKKFDYTKPPSIRAKVPNYSNKWNVEIYNTKGELIFPCDNENMTPMDFVPKKSNVACVLQCGGLWFGGKGWGITWKVNQIVVKPQEVQSVFGKCHIKLSSDEIQTIETQEIPAVVVNEEDFEDVISIPASKPPVEPVSTLVEDSDNEAEPVVVASAPVKKIIKKAVVEAPVPEVVEAELEPVVDTPAPVEAVVEPTVVKKKIIKKKA